MIEEAIAKFTTLLNHLLENESISFDEITPTSVPYDPGVYRVVSTSTDPPRTIYVGETTNLSNRLYTHLMGNRRASTLKNKLIERKGLQDEEAVKEYLRSECHAQYLIVTDERDRVLFEHFTIAVLSPELND